MISAAGGIALALIAFGFYGKGFELQDRNRIRDANGSAELGRAAVESAQSNKNKLLANKAGLSGVTTKVCF